jgi:hypothetical protein
MRRVLLGIGAAAILFTAGLAIATSRESADEAEPVTVYSTSYIITAVDESKP